MNFIDQLRWHVGWLEVAVVVVVDDPVLGVAFVFVVDFEQL